MGEQIRHKFEPSETEKKGFKTEGKEPELDKETKEEISSHLNYIETVEKSAIDSVRKRSKFPPELKELQEREKLINEWNQKAKEQLETGTPGEEILVNLTLPTPQEQEAEAQLRKFSKWLEIKELGEDKKEEIRKQIPLLENEIKFWRDNRKGWRKKFQEWARKLEEKKKERSKLE